MKCLLQKFLLFLLVFSTCLSAFSQKAKNTRLFIKAFENVDNVIAYRHMRDTIQKAGKEVKKSTTISGTEKTILKDDYEATRAKADALIEKITSDLLSKEQRNRMFHDSTAYFDDLSSSFKGIKSTSDEFFKEYAKTQPGAKGPVLEWLLKKFLIPVAEEFLQELITKRIKNIVDTKLKKALSITPWENL